MPDRNATPHRAALMVFDVAVAVMIVCFLAAIGAMAYALLMVALGIG